MKYSNLLQMCNIVLPNKKSSIADINTSTEDFNYKVCLDENKEDLDNFLKFLDVYGAEYESEK